MGTQGEIYNVLGLRMPAKVMREDELYSINGKTVKASDTLTCQTDLVNGIPTASVDLENPAFIVRLLGYKNNELRGRDFESEALVGYVVANESYEGRSKVVPSQQILDVLKPRLIEDIRKKLGYDAKASELELHLMFDWAQ